MLNSSRCRTIAERLVDAVKEPRLWKLWYTFVPKPEEIVEEIDPRLGLQNCRIDAAVYGIRCRRQDRGHDSLRECRCRKSPGRDRIDLVLPDGAAQSAQHPMPILPACARLRGDRLHRGRVPARTSSTTEPARDRAARRRQDGILRNHQVSPNSSRCTTLWFQHHRLGVADGEGASTSSTTSRGANRPQRSDVGNNGSVRLWNHWLQFSQQHARQPT